MPSPPCGKRRLGVIFNYHNKKNTPDMKNITDFGKKAILYLKKQLRKNKFFVRLDNTTISKFAGAKRGNKVYAYLMQQRIDPIVKTLTKDGNARFITLTHNYDYTDPKQSWLYMRKALPKFIRRAKFESYVYVYEAHAKGGCHVHLIVRGGPSYDRIRAIWDGHVKVKKVLSSEVGAYLAKEIGKQGHVETALKHAEVEKLTDTDVKKIWRFYYLLTLKMRGWGASRDLSVMEPVDEEIPPDLINNINNSTEADKPKVYELPETIIWNPEFKPYCGKVEPGTEEYRLILDFLEKKQELVADSTVLAVLAESGSGLG